MYECMLECMNEQTFACWYAGEPVLVFCASRKQTQSCAELLAELLPGPLGCAAVAEAAQEVRRALVVKMQDAMGGFSNAALEKLMLAGQSICPAAGSNQNLT